jgi:pantoate--beta-alanine ligase
MKKITSVSEMQQLARAARAKGASIALVPTMGALHEGHLALIRAARERAETVVVSIFVNPLQFSPSEGLKNYPRTLEADLAACDEAKVDLVFAPSAEEMYPKGYSSFVTEEAISKPLCGVSRPTHFRGVTTVVAMLLNIIRPDCLVMGRKDAQQAAVVRKMIADLHFGVELVVVPTVREADGLAHGVRNRELTTSQRQEALVIHQALKKAKEMADAGVRSSDRLVAEATHIIGQRRRVRVIYVSIVDGTTMEAMREVVPGRSFMVIAVWVDEIRFIDNCPL